MVGASFGRVLQAVNYDGTLRKPTMHIDYGIGTFVKQIL